MSTQSGPEPVSLSQLAMLAAEFAPVWARLCKAGDTLSDSIITTDARLDAWAYGHRGHTAARTAIARSYLDRLIVDEEPEAALATTTLPGVAAASPLTLKLANQYNALKDEVTSYLSSIAYPQRKEFNNLVQNGPWADSDRKGIYRVRRINRKQIRRKIKFMPAQIRSLGWSWSHRTSNYQPLDWEDVCELLTELKTHKNPLIKAQAKADLTTLRTKYKRTHKHRFALQYLGSVQLVANGTGLDETGRYKVWPVTSAMPVLYPGLRLPALRPLTVSSNNWIPQLRAARSDCGYVETTLNSINLANHRRIVVFDPGWDYQSRRFSAVASGVSILG